MKLMSAILRKTLSASLLAVALSLPIFGCAPGSYGQLDFQLTVADIFESGQILEDHSYYYIGPDAEPFAIMAVDKKYELAPSLWKSIDLSQEQLNAWNLRIDNRYRFRDKYKGAVILDQDGNRLGIWYSRIDWTTIKKGEGNQVIIYTPDTTRAHDNEGGGVIWGGSW